jgi:hypothetical protein
VLSARSPDARVPRVAVLFPQSSDPARGRLVKFAADLHQVRVAAGQPPYRQMAVQVHYAASAPATVSAWQQVFKDANASCARKGVPIRSHPHALRHSFAVITLEQLWRGHLAALAEMNLDQRETYQMVFGDRLNWVRVRLGHPGARAEPGRGGAAWCAPTGDARRVPAGPTMRRTSRASRSPRSARPGGRRRPRRKQPRRRSRPERNTRLADWPAL